MPKKKSPISKAAVSEPVRMQLGIFSRTGKILWRTLKAFIDDNVARLGAALAFYTTIAVAPLLVLAVAVAGFFLGEGDARETVIGEISRLTGASAGKLLESIQDPVGQREGVIATVLGGATLLFGAFGVFYHLQVALNSIWRVHSDEKMEFRDMLKQRLFSFISVLATGFLLMVSLIASAALSFLGAHFFSSAHLPVFALQFLNNSISFIVITALFALIFKLLPDTDVQWRHVWLGSVVTAALFTVGKSLLGYYLAHTSLTSAYGAAASAIALLLWCYYAAQILFLGAEFTRVTARSHGGRDFTELEKPSELKRSAR
ncbi:YihY/virulence factor BrkB family protein [Oleiharenicola lentus]|uniref:YihY/virulence factor BrkB family protein n=1 Tax=Oleiharenicola lentus TaxID=2508720 RepID=UPI003F665626